MLLCERPLSRCGYSLVFQGQIQCYASLGFGAILEIAKEADQCVKANDQAHAQIEHRGAANEVVGILHVVLQGHNYTDAFQGKDDRAEEQRPLHWRNHARALSWRWQVRKHIDERYDNAHKHQNIGNHREGRQKLQIAHQAHEHQRRRHNHNPQTHAEHSIHVNADHLLYIGSHKHQIDAAATKQIDHQKSVDHEAYEAGPAIQRGWTIQKGLFGDICEAHHWYLATPAEYMRALDQHVYAVGAQGAHE